ncbi:nuclear pore complex protein Nup160 homolog isoform X2 [Bradysia coprophila]|uniref:nuclear pore complex protein Nup160 homolog isoform X2 n=1 Tax=Bradysia coprophila TaxID=38358 RepID=UPI00187DB638|nr:nuclear pore complex protein Nup160 homolog isoform X2 [Bradysia coprophila]
MDEFPMSYREVIPGQTNPQLWKDISLNTGGTQSTQDIKVAEKAGGYCYKNAWQIDNRNRFIYWRTCHDTLELSEISLDVNLLDNHVRYKFADSPVLTVSIFETQDSVILLVVTVSSLHRLTFSHPSKLQQKIETQSMSILHEASANPARDKYTFHVIGNLTATNHPIPHTAACWLLNGGEEAVFATAYHTTLMLFVMNCESGKTVPMELKQNYIVPRILSNITGALRGKTNSPDSKYVSSLVFNTIGDQTFLYALYRDEQIRMWSTRTGQCVSTVNCLQEGIDARPQGPQSNLLRRSSPTTICAYLCYSMGSEFVTIQTQYDLVDFEVNDNRIWGLWCNPQGEYNICSYSFLSSSGWVSAAMEPPPDRCIVVENGCDPKQIYCSYIFHPGKFQRSVIDQALMMFRRSNILSDPNLPISILKDRVCQAVEQEVQNEISEYEMTDEEYVEVSAKHWEAFYLRCEQYQEKSCQPIGLVIMQSVGAVCIVKKTSFSLLRPCDTLEHVMIAGDSVEIDLDEDIVKLVSVLAMLEQPILEDIKREIDNKMYYLHIPNVVIEKFVSDMLSKDDDGDMSSQRDFILKLHYEIKTIGDLSQAMIRLLDELRMDTDEETPLNATRHLITLFGSDIGISVVSESLRQIALIRYSLCRNLLILQHILFDTFDIPCNVLEVIRSQCMPDTMVYVQAYYVMMWMSETPAQSGTSSASLESSLQRLATLQLSDARHIPRSVQPITLLELFLRGKGIVTGLSALNLQFKKLTDQQWQYTLVPLVKNIGQLVWAVSGNFIFGEWLLSSCQHILIQEYVRLLNRWCEWNSCSRHFILAVSLLENGEAHKAYDMFMKAASGVLTETFLEKIILTPSAEGITYNMALTQYYLKVIQLFEQHSALDHVISLARAAIGILDKNDPQLAMFQSIVFTNHLQLEHYDEAYHALIDNSEPSRRKDCLRLLVVCLFQQNRSDLLMKYPYIRLQDDLEDIVESRARSMAIERNHYYEFLYAFHVTKGNFRKASSIMYEQAMRYALECDTIESVQCRYECLLACLNALNLCDENYAWIAKPVINEDNGHNSEDMETNEIPVKQNVIVLQSKDIRQELLIADTILCLSKHRQEIGSILNADTDQLIAVLANTGLYTAAVKLTSKLEKSVAPVLESLAAACVRASEENSNEVWSWLQENDIADLPQKNSAVDMAWKLLEVLLDDYETGTATTLRKSVANKILSLGEFLPHWLYLSYKKANPSELLYLYVNHGRLIEATELAVDYVSAMLRFGGEFFGLSNSMHITLPPMCLPVNTIDLLIYGLELNADQDECYRECLDELRRVVQFYLTTAKAVSDNKIRYASDVGSIDVR